MEKSGEKLDSRMDSNKNEQNTRLHLQLDKEERRKKTVMKKTSIKTSRA